MSFDPDRIQRIPSEIINDYNFDNFLAKYAHVALCRIKFDSKDDFEKKYLEVLDDDTLYSLIEVVKSLNIAISEDPSLGTGFCIGHSYFCGQKPCNEEEMLGWMTSVVDYDIIPMLEEYWFDEQEKMKAWKNRLQGVFNN